MEHKPQTLICVMKKFLLQDLFLTGWIREICDTLRNIIGKCRYMVGHVRFYFYKGGIVAQVNFTPFSAQDQYEVPMKFFFSIQKVADLKRIINYDFLL